MRAPPRISRVEVHRFQWETENLGYDHNGFNLVYTPGGRAPRTGCLLRLICSDGLIGEYVGGSPADYAQMDGWVGYLLGRNPLERERIHNDVKRALRKCDRMSMGPVDITLWDLAGKLYGAPIYELLGGWRTRVPAYASTYHGDDNGGLDSPEAFADFAEQCLEMGYPAFKIHGWGNAPIEREVANVLAVGARVGDRMDLMIDPACELNTFADALKIGRACDEAGYLWLEDPYKDTGISAYAHRKLRQLIRTPILMGEHVRSFEPKVDLAIAEATDFWRADPNYDMGITGVMKIAHAAEGFGMDVELHAPGPAQRHCLAAIRNANYYELGLVHPLAPESRPPVYADDYSDALDAIDAEGCVPVPNGPGLGVTYDWDFIEAHRTGLQSYE